LTRKRQHAPLNPLRNFEVAARHGNFRKAASELNVTPAAVSRQIGVLEGYLGVALFERSGNKVQLTSAGKRLLPSVTTAMDLLDESVRQLRRPPNGPLVICTYLPLAMKWLLPRLPNFCNRFPDIPISLTTAVKPEEYNYGQIDVGLLFDRNTPADLETTVIMPDLVVPVCSPALCVGNRPLPPVANLRHHTFLHSRYRRHDWSDWLRLAGFAAIAPEHELTFGTSGLAHQAAAEGLGVSVAQRLLVAEELESGRLAMPFNMAMQRPTGIRMVCQRERLRDPRVAALRDWLISQAQVTVDSLGIELRQLEVDAPRLLEVHNQAVRQSRSSAVDLGGV
jgi:LysR family glycine cleavage system transcriptional activator